MNKILLIITSLMLKTQSLTRMKIGTSSKKTKKRKKFLRRR